MNTPTYLISLLFLLALLLTACEERFLPDIPEQEDQIVVEGYIEGGELGLPPYVILTRSLPFFSRITANELNDIFIHDAKITISASTGEVVNLEEICWDDFEEEEQELIGAVLQSLGVVEDSIPFNFCVYVDPELAIRGTIGETYALRVEADGEVLTAETTIPPHIPLDSLYFTEPPGDVPEEFRELRVLLTDDENLVSFYRYLTATGVEPFLAPLNSVVDDRFFDGQSFEFPLPKAEPIIDRQPDDVFGYYTLGDTATIKWTTIDEAHFNFWNTLEFNFINQGPFGSYTRIDSNVEGGLGIWGGYAVSYYVLIVED